MKQLFIFFLYVGLQAFAPIYAQTDSLTVLGKVLLTHTRLRDSAYTTNVQVLNDSILKRNQASLTNLLNYNSTIYFKENGLGMVSSPSFRGTTAAQTAVLWNGIPINSQTTGQTDFNTISVRGFDAVTVSPGGGSATNGSGAIGGTINLQNKLGFSQGFQQKVFAKYGEFDTYELSSKSSYSDKKFSVALGVSKVGSANDYDYVGSDRKNINGQFQNLNVSLTAGTRLNAHNEIRLYANIYDGKRHFSVPTPNALKTKYYDFNTRSLLSWKTAWKKFTSTLKLASTTENYKYFPTITNPNHSFGKVRSTYVKYHLGYHTAHQLWLDGGLNFEQDNGEGSDIMHKKRALASAEFRLKQKLTEHFLYEVSLRQSLNEDYDNPLLYSAGIRMAITDFYDLKLNTSKNYRIPTYNDLYWQELGNSDLKPESSYQVEISNNFHVKEASLQLTAYYNNVKNLLMWVPTAGGIFRPRNTHQVAIRGLEALLKVRHQIGQHQLALSATYAYTVSENKETHNQLIYVPYHKLTGSVSDTYKNFSVYYQYLNNGEVFTTTDNAIGHILDSYMVANLGVEYTFGTQKDFTIGTQVLNLWNESYASVLNRPLPGRNFNIYLNLKF